MKGKKAKIRRFLIFSIPVSPYRPIPILNLHKVSVFLSHTHTHTHPLTLIHLASNLSMLRSAPFCVRPFSPWKKKSPA